VNTFTHREPWLHAVADRMHPLFAAAGHQIPANIRVACGFPSRGAAAVKVRTLGECWASNASKDGHFEILVSPTIDDPMRVAGVLAHELIHAAIAPATGHGRTFAMVARAIGLRGPMTATTEGEAFKRAVAPILEAVGPYPHAELQPAPGRKKQTTRLIKCECHGVNPDDSRCGYPVRTTRYWLDREGPPHCPRHGAMVAVKTRPNPPTEAADET
jgi:hypothetical protein